MLFTIDTSAILRGFILSNRLSEKINVNLTTKEPLHPDTIQTICDRIQKGANIKKSISLHKWRHTFASRFVDKDGNIFVLQMLLGHTDITMTQKYVTLSIKKTKK